MGCDEDKVEGAGRKGGGGANWVGAWKGCYTVMEVRRKKVEREQEIKESK